MRSAAQGAWSTGLCECCEPPDGCSTCCYAYWCPCCQYGQNVARMPPGEVYCGGNCYGACCCYFIMVELGFCCCIHCGARAWIRNKYGIPGDGCQDCCTTMCCPLCAMCQEHRELTIRHVQHGGKEMDAANKVKPAVPSPPMMMVAPVAPPPQQLQPAYVPPPQAYVQPPPQAYPPPPSGYAAPAPPGYAPPPQAFAAPPPQAYAQPPPQAYAQPPPQAYAQPPPQAYVQAYSQPMYVQGQQEYGGKHHRRSSSSSDE